MEIAIFIALALAILIGIFISIIKFKIVRIIFPFLILYGVLLLSQESAYFDVFKNYLLVSLILQVIMGIMWGARRNRPHHLIYGNLAVFINLGIIYLALVLFFDQFNFYDIASQLCLFIISINISSIIFYGFDKFISPISKQIRLPEDILHWHSFLLGTPGAFLSRILFRHKINKKNKKEFIAIFLATLISQTILIIAIILLVSN